MEDLFKDPLHTPFIWSEKWLLGIPLIDSQHARLFTIIEDLRVAILQDRTDEQLEMSVKSLIYFCSEHFDSEELLMGATNYPSIEGHSQIHRNLEVLTDSYMKQLNEGTLNAEALLKSMMDIWLAGHVLVHDVQMPKYFRKAGIDAGNIRTLDDLAILVRNDLKGWKAKIKIAHSSFLFLLPLIVLQALTAFTNQLWIFGLAVALVLVVELGRYFWLRQLTRLTNKPLLLQNIKRLGEAVIAGEIAKKVAVLSLDDIDELFGGNSGFLIHMLREIVDHIKLIVPYIPGTVLSQLRGEDCQEVSDDETFKEKLVSPKHRDSSRISTHLPNAVNHRRSSDHRSSLENSVKRFRRTETSVTGSSELLVEDVTTDQMSDAKSLDRFDSGDENSAVLDAPVSPSNGRPATNRSHASAKKAKKDKLGRGIQKKSVSIMVVEMINFEAFVDALPSSEAVEIQSKFIEAAEKASALTRGVFTIAEGDRIMISWNAANSVGNHAEQACSAALKFMELTREIESMYHGLAFYIGIASGVADVGNLGTSSKLNFCILGNIPALAISLCSLNRLTNTRILVCAQTCADVCEMFLVKMVLPIEVIGETTLPSRHKSLQRASVSLEAKASASHGGPLMVLQPTVRKVAHFVFELKASNLQVVDEWMYAMEDNTKKNPFTAYHDAVKNVFTKEKFNFGIQQLEEYCKSHPEDLQANQLFKKCRTRTEETVGHVAWSYGWHPPTD